MHRLDRRLAAEMATLAIDNVRREYPNAPGYLLRSPDDLRPPHDVHPAFYGSYDWHSSVHQHWLLVRLLRLDLLDEADANASREVLSDHLTPDRLTTEADYLRDRPAFERTYGWAWLLALAAELAASARDDARSWLEALAPAVEVVRGHWLEFLGRTTYPIRAGTHANSAFALTLALEYAVVSADAPFEAALRERAGEWFGGDRDYPAHLEPAGDDFLSAALMEASLMVRVLGEAFDPWLSGFLPALGDRQPQSIFTPAVVADRTDGKTVHLDGLNLSRAWCWRTVAARSADARVVAAGRDAAARHLDAGMTHLFGGDYVAEHWLTSFALLALSEPEVEA